MTAAPAPYIRCGCGKRGWKSKKAALSAQRHNGHKMRAYPCGRYWHVAKETR